MTHREKNKNENRKIIRRDPRWEEYWTIIYTLNKDEERLEEHNDSKNMFYEDDYK